MYPLFEEWHRFLGHGLSDDMMKNLHENKLKWDALIKLENEKEKSKGNGNEEEIVGIETGNDTSVDTSPIMEERGVEPAKKNNYLTVPEWHCNQRIGRRHSVPLSMQATEPEICRTILRRESLPVSEKRSLTVYHSGLLEEEEEEEEVERERNDDDDDEESTNVERSISFVSSASDDIRFKIESDEDKVLSSENLLPEPSITSITTVTEASRLSNVLGRGQSPLRGTAKSHLTRQQTFPPVQPYVRQRYLSATVEMSRCMNVAGIANKSSSSSRTDMSGKRGLSGDSSVDLNNDTHCGSSNGSRTPPFCKTAVLRENNNRSCFSVANVDSVDKTSSPSSSSNGKRETPCSSHDRVKMAKLWDERFSGCHEKENLDPRKFSGNDLDVDLLYGHRMNSTQVRFFFFFFLLTTIIS